MAKKSKLFAALDAEKGRDYKLEKQKKLQKQAEKRKRIKLQQQVEEQDEWEDEDENIDEEEEEVEVNGKLRAAKKQIEKTTVPEVDSNAGSEKDESDEDEGEDEDSENEDAPIVSTNIDESDSDSDSDGDNSPSSPQPSKSKNSHHLSKSLLDQENEDDNEDSDVESEASVALSDLSSQPSDVVPHSRLTINNTSALLAALSRISLPSDLPFSAHLSHTPQKPTEIADVNDDLTRELAFYKQSLLSVQGARLTLSREKPPVPFSRPTDFFAEMVKTDEQMMKVKDQLRADAAGKKASQEAKKQRELRKFGKQVQVAKEQARAKEKRAALDQVEALKRKRKASGGLPTSTTEAEGADADIFDVGVDNEDTGRNTRQDKRRKVTGSGNDKRAKKDAKYGFGGKKRFAKSGDTASTADMSGYSVKKMKSGGKGGSKRLGKSRRKTAR
ncbi:MAG: rRNA-processing protein and EBNA1-binding protein ebp2 [Cirrosporium novae-zelandiae]|nr:MAG: rRNA-processing protein and EBNA1-binding protein ebp2 [Cirrosporium novae-zelandiae]